MSFDLTNLNWLAIAVVCVATFILGGIWYTLLGPLWIKYNNYTTEQVAEMKKLRPPPVFFGGMIVSYFVFAVFLAIVLRNMSIPTWTAAALAGAAIWLAIALPIGVTSWIASNKQFGVYLIDLAYQLVFIVGASVIFALWR